MKRRALEDPRSRIDLRLVIVCEFEPNRTTSAAGGRLQVTTSNRRALRVPPSDLVGRALSLGGRTHRELWTIVLTPRCFGDYRFTRERRGGARKERNSVDSALPPRPEIAHASGMGGGYDKMSCRKSLKTRIRLVVKQTPKMGGRKFRSGLLGSRVEPAEAAANRAHRRHRLRRRRRRRRGSTRRCRRRRRSGPRADEVPGDAAPGVQGGAAAGRGGAVGVRGSGAEQEVADLARHLPTAEMAARAHDVAAIALRGRSACLNFADSATLLPIPPSFATTRDIQRAAAEAAEAFRPPEFSPNSPAAATTPPSDADAMSEFYANNAAGGSGSGSGGNVNVNVIGGGGDEGFSGWMSYDDLDAGMYYASMAEGWFVEPPTSRDGGHSNWDEGDGGCDDEVSLWSYSI
uniref:AP2/ERF domain-containing protein n=1 Tax=Ananas comosus var. bracteatus TaxID=296719 RepID=A0A6V7PHC4_ANACO|nr:unnamed protein product [Ananas comosus var. bracteatus]